MAAEQYKVDIRSVFTNLPGSNVLVFPDAPTFTIVAVSDAFLEVTGRTKEELKGKGLFDAFPNNPEDPSQISEKTVRASLEYALAHKEPHHLPLQRYDITTQDGTYMERYWLASNKPVVAENGEVVYLIHSVTDVTSKTLADQREARIRSIENAYSLFMQAPVIIGIVKGADHVIELANENMLQLWGKGPEVIGKPMMEALPEMKGQGFADLLNNVYQTGEPYYANGVAAMLVRNGRQEVRYLDFIYQPYYEENETVASGIFAVAHDVTEQVLARQKAAESEHRFQGLIAEATVATAIYVGREMTIQYANEAMIRLWGKDTSAIGKTIRQALPELENQPFHQQLDQVFTTGETYWGKEDKGEIVVDGKLQTFYYNFSYKALRNADGEIYGILNMATDVTEQVLSRKRIEEKNKELQFVMDVMPQLVWRTQPDGKGDFFNQVYLDYSGLAPHQLAGHQWTALLHPDDVAYAAQEWQKSLSGNNDSYSVEHRLLGKDGRYRWFLTRGVPHKNEEGQILRWYGTSTDIDEQKKAEALLEQRVKERTLELQARNKELEQFTYVSHHDLQEPLRKIVIFSDMVKAEAREKLSELSLSRLDKVTQAALRMSAALKDVLDYASLDKEEHFVGVDLQEVVKAVLTDLELVINEKGAQLFVEQLPLIKAVPQQMHQLFYNLLNNALKFAKAGEPPVIQISCRSLEAAEINLHASLDPTRHYYEIMVKDNGIGFEPEAVHKIFDMFQRLHSRDAYAGTGIGLALCKKLVANHDGYIWAESKPGAGATFKVLLPVD